MTPTEAAAILRQHNAWRRDRHEVNRYEMQNPALIGEAIDVAVKFIEAHTDDDV